MPYRCSATLCVNGQEYDAKAAMTLLLAGIETGAVVEMCFAGEDERPACEAVEKAMLPAFFSPQSCPIAAVVLVPGTALAPAVLLCRNDGCAKDAPFGGVEAECRRFEAAVDAVADDCLRAGEHLSNSGAAEQASIFRAHAALIREPLLIQGVRKAIHDQRLCADEAVEKAMCSLIARFEEAPGDVTAQRTADLRDLKRRLLAALSGKTSAPEAKSACILVGQEVLPGDIARQDPQNIKGIATGAGGASSHVAIIARSLGVPLMLCPPKAIAAIRSGQLLALLGEREQVLVDPDETQAEEIRRQINADARRKQALQKYARLCARTLDGRQIQIHANVESVQSAQIARRNGADGAGLFRTEYVFMNRSSAPTEEEQFQEYRAIAQTFAQGAVIRTLDVGADKMIPYLHFPQGENPLLGTRGIRFTLAHPSIFSTQLRALLRASAFGNVKIMFPFISTLEELREAKALLEQAKDNLRSAGISFDEGICVGMMVELPSAAMLADCFAQEVNFFSIGTNDLLQYTFATERCCDSSRRLQAHHPALLRLIYAVAKAAHRAGIEVSICGAAAESATLLPVWLAMGIDKLSVGSAALLERKQQVSTLNLTGCQAWLDKALACPCADDVLKILNAQFGNVPLGGECL